MQTASSVADNSESQDGEDKCHGDEDELNNASLLTQNESNLSTSGYYDAEKCRAHIANQTRVSKIDRFAAQIQRAIEVEADVNTRLAKILNMYVRHSSRVVHDFTTKCRLGSQRHRQDRILNHTKNGIKKQMMMTPPSTISNDLLYGEGAYLVQELLSQAITFIPTKPTKRRGKYPRDCGDPPGELSSSTSSKGQETFDPSIFVKKLQNSIMGNIERSEAIIDRLNALQQSFKNLATEQRNKVDHVYAAEEERQATTIVRRSAYNLSIAAIKATSTPIHVSLTLNDAYRS